MASVFPESIISALNRPLDDKTNKLDLTERNALPMSQRYKGMFVVVQNTLGAAAKVYWLPTDNLTNSGWVEFEAGDGVANGNAYKHIQAVASDIWLIQHNLNSNSRAYSIMAMNAAGEQIVGFVDLAASTNNLLVYRFGVPLAGEADIKL